MLEWIKRELDKIGSPTLDWVQVEVTTYCNGSCIYCPHTVMRKRWANRHMPIELFHELIPFLRCTELVYLQGWGEPLLNKNFFEMVRICKDRGKRVGFTTNGTLLTEDTIRTLVDLHLDIIGISLAGTTASTHNQIRKGTDFNKVISHLERLRKIKTEKRTEVPAVHLAYLMLKSNFHELKEILLLAKRIGAKQIVASNQTLIVDPKLSAQAIFNDTQRMGYYRTTLDEISHRAAREEIVFDYHGPGLDDASLRCRENVHRACVINVEGEVVPCVMTNPVLSPSHYIFKNQSVPLRGMSFGNIRKKSLTRIWNKKEYARFRALFDPETARKPEQIRSEMPLCCVKCYKRLGA
ncbi:MAG: radical SAM protein [Desulfobacterales bacterium]|nr:radical SAM protein [Desulfobacterales bacterium]